MTRFLLALTCGVFGLAAQPNFEVASVKQNTSADFRSGMGMKTLPGGRVSIKNFPLLIVIATAYDLPFQSTRLTGGPDWIRAERYDIEATAPEGGLSPSATGRERDAVVRKMLQSLLVERFKLVMERETKDQPVYAVVVGKKGVKLTNAGIDEKECAVDDAPGKVSCHNFRGGQGRGLHSDAASIEDAATFVSNWSDRPVVDQTGITTLFKFDTLGWVPMRPMPGNGAPTSPEGLDDPLRPSLFGIFEQMGLKLEARRGPIESFHIRSVEHPGEQ